MSRDSVHQKLKEFHKKFTRIKKFNPQTKKNKDLKTNVLEDAGDLFNKLHSIYKEKYEERKDALNKKVTKNFHYTKLKLLDDYLYESEEEKEQTDKPTKSGMHEFSDFIFYREMGIKKELFQKHFKYQMPTDLLNAVYNTDD